jgi:hypothetical protein
MTDNVIRDYSKCWPKERDTHGARTLTSEELARLPKTGHLHPLPKFVSCPAHNHLQSMLSEFHELRGLDDHQGRVYVWPAASVDHVTAAAILGIPYDPATDDLNGKAFYLRSMEDWANRKDPPGWENRVRLRKLRVRLKKLKQERGELRNQGKMRPERLP